MKKALFNITFLIVGLLTISSVIAQNDHKDKDDHKREEPKYKKTKSQESQVVFMVFTNQNRRNFTLYKNKLFLPAGQFY